MELKTLFYSIVNYIKDESRWNLGLSLTFLGFYHCMKICFKIDNNEKILDNYDQELPKISSIKKFVNVLSP